MASFSAMISLLLLVLSVSLLYVPRSFSQSSSECMPVMMLNMGTCISYVTVGSFVDEPDTGCCIGLKIVLDTKPVCLCEMLKSDSVIGYKLNTTRTSTLPAACNVDAPPVSACGLAPTSSPPSAAPVPPPSSPTSSPASSPASSPTSSPPSEAPGCGKDLPNL